MALPTPIKTWTLSTNNRVTAGAGVGDTTRGTWLGIKNFLKTASGVTVVGSSNGTLGALDATDRWTTTTDVVHGISAATNHSWIILRFANMGNIDLLLDYNSSTAGGFRLSYSPGRLFTLASPATRSPTATDEQVLFTATSYDPSTAVADRLWSAGVASDGSTFWVAAARAGSFFYFAHVGLAISAVQAPATFSPAVIAYNHSTSTGALNQAAQFMNTQSWRCLVNGVSTLGYGGGETYGVTSSPQSLATTIQQSLCELQGGSHLMQPISVWSVASGALGKVGNIVDLWAGPVVSAHFDTLPNDTTRQFIMIGDLAVKWDGSLPVTA